MEKIWNKKFILLFITNLLMMATFYASVPILPIYCQQNGITGSKIGIVLSAIFRICGFSDFRNSGIAAFIYGSCIFCVWLRHYYAGGRCSSTE